MMREYQFNRLTQPGPQSNNRRCRSDVADRIGRIVALRQSRPEIRTVIRPLSAAGVTCQLDRAMALFKRMDGVSGACLFFNQAALRVYYHPEQTNALDIIEALQAWNPNFRDYINLEKDFPRAAVSG